MKTALMAAIILALVLGCAYVPPSGRAWIHKSARNCAATVQAVYAIDYPPTPAEWDMVKTWWYLDSQEHAAMDDYAHGRANLPGGEE